MKQSPTVNIPAATIDKLAALGRAMLALAEEMKQQTGKTHAVQLPSLKRPAHIPIDEEWFWSDEWQTGEQETNAELKAGRYKTFNSIEDLLADLHHHV